MRLKEELMISSNWDLFKIGMGLPKLITGKQIVRVVPLRAAIQPSILHILRQMTLSLYFLQIFAGKIL